MKNTGILFCFLIGIMVSSCTKEHAFMHREAGAWEIKSWEGITYLNGAITKDTTVNDMGHLLMYDNDLNGQNDCHYHLTYSPPVWTLIANSSTHLDPNDDYCWWESDTYDNDRVSLETTDDLSATHTMMFTITKNKKNEQTWVIIGGGNDSLSTMSSKDVFILERK